MRRFDGTAKDMLSDEDQKFMALEGIHTWARGVLDQVAQMQHARADFRNGDWHNDRRRFERARYFFLLSANRLLEYIDWAIRLKFLDESTFAEFLAFRDDIKFLRNKNEHVVEYFEGKEPPAKWWNVGAENKTDASATFETKIGGRLDWAEVAPKCEGLIASLPAHYAPKRPS